MKEKEIIEIRPIEIEKVKITIVGDSPLIVHNWTPKAKREMLEAQQGKKAGKKKEPKNPAYDFVESLYWQSEKPEVTIAMPESEIEEQFCKAVENGATFGFRATGIKQAAISAAYRLGWSKDKASLRGVFFIDSDENGLVEIQGSVPEIREDMVRVMGNADIRYRGEFKEWFAEITVSYNKNGRYSLENIVNMINAGGYICGIGEWRPEKDGQNGMFHVEAK